MSYFPAVKIQATGTINGTNYPNTAFDVTQHNQRLDCNVMIDDGVNLDAFSRLRVSQPGWRFDGAFTYQFNTDIWDQYSSSGSIYYDSTNRLATLVNNAGTNVTLIQSHYHSPYTPGRSQLAFCTFNFKTAPSSGQTKRAGYFDGNNGVFLEWDATNGISVVCASDTLNGTERVVKANWNIDKLDGTGPSGVTLDLTKTQIFFVSIQALYVGRVICGFDIDGVLVPVHAFTHANKVVYPYIQQASLPIRYEVRGTNSTSANMDAICASVISEGGSDLLNIGGRAFAVSVTSGTSVTTSTQNPMVAIRPKQTFNNVRNSALVVPQQMTIFSRSNGALIRLIRNGTITPAVWTDVDTNNSTCEYSLSATSITGGQIVYAGMCGQDAAQTFLIGGDTMGRLIGAYSHVIPANPGDTFAVVILSLNATATVTCGLGWKEIR